VLVVNGTTLSASNLGDSGFVLVRDGVATFQCPQQQHNFNFPFQLGSADSMSDQPQAAMVGVGGHVMQEGGRSQACAAVAFLESSAMHVRPEGFEEADLRYSAWGWNCDRTAAQSHRAGVVCQA
jgi:hypothetical protein